MNMSDRIFNELYEIVSSELKKQGYINPDTDQYAQLALEICNAISNSKLKVTLPISQK